MASREENEAMGGLLKRSLSREDPRDGCLDPELLAAYFDHSLAASEAERCDAHLSRCARCRQGLAALVRAGESQEVPAPQRESVRTWLADWRWLTAAAAVLAVVTLWAVGRPERITKVALPGNTPLAALARQTPGAASPARPEPANSAITISRDKLSRARSAPSRPERPGGPANEEAAERFASGKPESRAPPSAKPVAGDVAKSLPETPAGSGGGIGEGTGGGASPQATRKTENPVERPGAGPQTFDRLPTSSPIASEDPNTKQMETLAPSQPNSALAGPSLRTPSRYRAIQASAAAQALEQRTNVIVISTPSPSVKWRITKPSFVERTEDGGATWFGEEVDANGSLLAASAPDAKTCWAVGGQGAVYVTKDAQTWKKTTAPTDADLIAVAGRNGSSAIVTTADGRRFSTRDGGKKWKPLSSSADSDHH